MKTTIDERQSPRIERDAAIFLELRSSSVTDTDEIDIVLAQSFDLSDPGVQIVLDRNIPEGNIIQLCLDIRDSEPIFVVARVIWGRQDTETGAYHIGFKLLESKGTDFDQWQQTVAAMFPT